MSFLPQNPWAVSPGLYFRTDGQIINLSGPTHFWDKNDSGQGNTGAGNPKKGSTECQAGSTRPAEEELNGQGKGAKSDSNEG